MTGSRLLTRREALPTTTTTSTNATCVVTPTETIGPLEPPDAGSRQQDPAYGVEFNGAIG
jgi:hypothetical protein